MTPYTHVESNTRKTWFLLFGFLIFIIILGWFFSYTLNNQSILIFAIIFSVLMNLGSYWYSDKIVLMMVRAKLIEKKDNPGLYRIVENLCITAGLPLPKIYIIDEAQPNAFATGRNEKHAVIAVTKGLLEKLEKAELEGVIAHELSHIGNRDIFLSTVIVIFVGIIAMLSDFFLRISFFRKRGDNEDSRITMILMVLGIVAAILAPLAAVIIQLAISRKREFLADASGALLTRYPEGLSRALEKISQDPHSLKVASNTTAHLYFASPFRGKESKSFFHRLFMTHPPIEERIKILQEMKI